MEEEHVIQFTDEQGKIYNFYHIATLDYEEKTYAFFQPAEEMEGVDPNEVVIYELTADNDLLPVMDQQTLDAVFNAFLQEMEDDDCDCGCEECGHEHHHHHCDCGCEDCGEGEDGEGEEN